MTGFLVGTDPGLRQTRTPTVDVLTDGVGYTSGSSTTITLTDDPGSENHVVITFDGVVQHHDTYSQSGAVITFDAAIPSGVAKIEAIFAVTVASSTVPDDSVTLAKLAGGTDGELITWDASGDPAAVGAGTSGQVLTSNGAGAEPTFQAGSANDILLYQEQQTSGTNASPTSHTAGAWRTCTLNTEVIDTGSIGSLSSNQVSLPSGSYEVFANAHFECNNNQVAGRLRIYNASDTAAIVYGAQDHLPATAGTEATLGLTVMGQFTIAATKLIELQVYPDTNNLTNMNSMTTGDVEVYSTLYFRKYA